MAQEYVISNVYPVMKADKVTQSSFEAHGNKLMKWRLFFEGVDGHYVTNRKEGNDPSKGEEVYGSIGEDRFGNPTFTSESRPLGQLPSQPQQAQASAAPSPELEQKVDYLIGLVEEIAKKLDSSGERVDLSEIPF